MREKGQYKAHLSWFIGYNDLGGLVKGARSRLGPVLLIDIECGT